MARDPDDRSNGDALTGRHARNHTPEVSDQATREARELGDTQPEGPATEHADKTHPPDGKPSKPA